MSRPPEYLVPAMEHFRAGDMAGALNAAEIALIGRPDDLALLALASLTALQLAAPERAVPHLRAHHALAPDDRAVSVNLATALAETGDREEALAIAAGSDDHALARLEGYLLQEEGDVAAAISAYEKAVAAKPEDMQSWNNLGNLRGREDDVDGAIDAYERAITLAPNQISIYLNLARLLEAADRHRPRLVTTQSALAHAPDNAELLTEHGLALAANDRMEDAVEIFGRAVAKHAQSGDQHLQPAHIELGMLLETLNRVPELEKLVADSEARGMDDAELAFLKAWVLRRKGAYAAAKPYADQIPPTINPVRTAQLRADIAERLGDSEHAFEEFVRMNAAAIANSPPPPRPSYREYVDAENRFWTTERIASLDTAQFGDGRTDPVFLVGFPRSGTTLLDTILMADPGLHVLEERPVLSGAMKDVDNAALVDLSDAQVLELRNRYFHLAQELDGAQVDKRLVDKHPLQMARIPVIHRLFPDAQIILAERHPFDVVLSCFMANFKLNFAMRSFNSLEEAARTYDAVFTSWINASTALPIDIRRVRYERLIADVEAEIRPLVDWLGLEWSPDFLDSSKTARERGRIRTASYSQVTEPIYDRAVGRWKRYRRQLEDVRPILAPWAEHSGYSLD